MTTILGAAASGMMAAQRTVDHTGTNIANYQSIGYKRERMMAEGVPNPTYSQESSRLGVAVTEADLIMTTGNPIATFDDLNFAINDDAFHRVTTSNGGTAYTRNGALGMDSTGNVLVSGLELDPPVTLPFGARNAAIGADGIITATAPDGTKVEVGPLQLYRFSNAKGLREIGGGLYTESANSGAIFGGTPGDGNFDSLLPGFVEGSNVEIADEMVQMMLAQRIYTANAKSFSIGDDMLRIATNLTR